MIATILTALITVLAVTGLVLQFRDEPELAVLTAVATVGCCLAAGLISREIWLVIVGAAGLGAIAGKWGAIPGNRKRITGRLARLLPGS
jgi:hypothetical protein